MTKLEKLIEDLCPDGVEYKEIGSVVDYEQPTKYIVENTNYDDSYSIPVLTAGQTFILGYTNEENGVYQASMEKPVIIFDDFTGAFKWVDFPFKVKSSAMKILTADASSTFIRYIYHVMGFLNFTSDEHKRLWISTYSQFKIPVPPIEVQEEIVRILDSFTEYIEELKAELKARKQQYSYYRGSLLDFNKNSFPKLRKMVEEMCPDGVEYKKVKDIVAINRGKRLTKKELSNEYTYDVYHGSKDTPLGRYKESNAPMNTTIIVNTGGIGGVKYIEKDFWCSDGSFWLGKSEAINSKFLYYCLIGQEQYFASQKRVGGVPTIDKVVVTDFKIPVPPIEIQNEIVRILDEFDEICNNVQKGLPSEIEAREKQYEFYRDNLLTFQNRSQFVNVEREKEREKERVVKELTNIFLDNVKFRNLAISVKFNEENE